MQAQWTVARNARPCVRRMFFCTRLCGTLYNVERVHFWTTENSPPPLPLPLLIPSFLTHVQESNLFDLCTRTVICVQDLLFVYKICY